MQERPDLTTARVNQDLLQFPFHTPLWFWIVAGALGLVVGAGLVTFGLMMHLGLQILGYTNTVYWSVLITNFVFWVGISHAGVMISAILRLGHAEWRRPVTRVADLIASEGPLSVTEPVIMEVLAGARSDEREWDLRRLLLQRFRGGMALRC